MAGGDARFELLTPRGPGGVAVIAVRGPDRHAAAGRLVAPPFSATPRVATLRLGETVVDEVLVVDRPGLQILELQLHGSPAVVRSVEEHVGGFVETACGRGEGLLRGARSPAQLALALEQRGFDLDGFLEEVSRQPVDEARRRIDAALGRSRASLALSVPRRLVLCGDQNAGKSTLMNRLLFEERVLTGARPGLTRDPVREGTLLDGYPYEVVDTAGEGAIVAGPAAEVDRRALELARGERRHGLLLLVVDGSRLPSESDRGIRNEHTLVVRSKADLSRATWPSDFPADVEVACLDPRGAASVRGTVGAALRRFRGLPEPGPAGGLAALTPAEQKRLGAARRDLAGT